ncbi:hypothetical protein [Microbacterium sp. CFBP 8794]|uniref:hypothetical protein n=1 Tax=Microbacterium sp. CFBP 8794 TaxID=2775269 RepID=UPI00177C4D21|nr:hypothetical protein [Microbacterium sp. CFBP 8794]MBD8477600.1 hypothetical protein [Microbacterium sp. CFBP 8794]
MRRTHLEFEGQFTQVPNAWARDKKLSRKARGLLVEIMSHRVGWRVSISGLQEAGVEGRDAIKSGLVELKNHGYLVVAQGRGERGRFEEVEYELHDPATGDGLSAHGGTADGLSADGSPADGSTASGKSAAYKNTSPLEDHLEEDHLSEGAIELVAAVSFDDFWAVWPRKVAKPDARRAWDRALAKVSGEVVLSAAVAHRDNPGRPETQFIPHPATWINREGWNDELPQLRAERLGAVDAGRRAAELIAEHDRLAVSA